MGTDQLMICKWDGAEITDPSAPCPQCGLRQEPLQANKPKEPTKQAKNRRAVERTTPWSDEPAGKPAIGVDPGARYTGVVVRDGDVVLYSSTIVCPKDIDDSLEFGRLVAKTLRKLVDEHFPGLPMGVEGVSAPKGYNRGAKSPINPKYIMFAAAVAGCVANEFEEAYIIAPGGNGTQHISQYPEALIGRRPKDLPGAVKGVGTRDHEKSAFDVAGKAADLHYSNNN